MQSRRASYPTPPSRFARMLAAFVLAMFTSGATLSWVVLTSVCCDHTASAKAPLLEEEDSAGDGCCPDDRSENDAKPVRAEVRQDVHDDTPCSCPIDCGDRCAGAPPSVLLPTSTLVLARGTSVELTFVTTRHPLEYGVFDDLLRVPKPSLARS